MKHCPQCSTGYPDTLAACPTHGLPLNEIRDLKPGMVIHHSYRIVRKLGQGGMGAVYLAQHTLMDEPRALKFLSAELSQDAAFTARFLREVRTLRQIRHPNVVDCGDLESAEDGSLFFSMEFVDGPDLRAFLCDAPQPFDVPLALDLTRQIAAGLAAAHARGMVHRDIKPENILLARDAAGWQPKIADFGIVATKESSSVFTRTGGTLLTVAYAAPEQWRGTPAAQRPPPRPGQLARPRHPRPPPPRQRPRRLPQRRRRAGRPSGCCGIRSAANSASSSRTGVPKDRRREG
jgi:serine/threonine-protein kinase